MTPGDQFRDAISAAGMSPPDVIEPGRFYRFPGAGKRNGNTAGWCKMFPDGLGGVFGDYSRDLTETWQARLERRRSVADDEAFRRNCEQARSEARAERERAQEEAAHRAAELWSTAAPAASHPYLTAKGVQAHGVRIVGDTLLVPMRDSAGKLWNVERISADGKEKKGLLGGRRTGCYHSIGKPSGTICIAEGYATGASVHEATGHAVAVAFNAGNLGSVASELRAKYPDATLILCADDDYRTDGNPGMTKATEAARQVDGLVAVPDFGADRPDGASDFNDLAASQGAEAVERAISNARQPEAGNPPPGDASATTGDSVGEEWPDLPLLTPAEDSAPYPIDALPGGIREAVTEVLDFVQCPPALAACSALSALSAAGQALANVRRAKQLEGPIGLFLLAVGDSGERKTTCDGHFVGAIREWDDESEQGCRVDVARRAAEIAAWQERKAGIQTRIREASKKGEDCDAGTRELADAEAEAPQPFRVPRVIHTDATPEALGWSLATGWPSGAVMSSEAGIVFGGHGMGRDSVMRNLSLLNALWDGASHRVERRQQGGSYTLAGARLTMGLAAQPETVRQFMEGTTLARGNGFAARFLIAAPATTQGTRFFRAAPEWRHLPAFAARLRALLALPVAMTEAGELTPPAIPLSDQAHAVWVAFHDDVERELRPSGEMADVRDVASKAADNVARMAALFHVYAHGPTGEVGADAVTAAARIVGWHLYQARRFLGEVAAPRELSNARRLAGWLADRCRREGLQEVGRRTIQNLGPNPLRGRAALDSALAELVESGHVREVGNGRRKLVRLHPALVGGADEPS